MHANNHSKHTKIYVKTRKRKTIGGKFYFNLKELQAEISGSVIIGALEFLLSYLLVGEGDVFITA